LFEDLRSRRKKRKGKKTFQSNFLVLSWEEYTKRIFTTGLKFEQFFQVPLLFVVQSKVLLVDEKWHLTRGFMFLD
jgi:Sec-independent protein secretion pathway component TatC